MTLPMLSCLCPTFRRPRLLENAIACFLAQDYPANRRELIILDDAGQFPASHGPNWRLISLPSRFRSLAEKYNALAGLSQGEYLVVWEDDDIYLPWHLSAHATALQRGEYSKPSRIWSHTGDGLNEEQAAGRFHGSIAFSRRVFVQVGGWPLTKRADFDQQLMAKFGDLNLTCDPCENHAPSYIYRWGTTNQYQAQHAMQAASDEEWYEHCGQWGDATVQPPLIAKVDSATRHLTRVAKRLAQNMDSPRSDQTTRHEPAASVDHPVKWNGSRSTNLSVLVPTIGRPSLRLTLQSIKSQFSSGDEVLLLSDGPISDDLRQLWDELALPGRLIEVPDGPHRDWGHTPRNYGLPFARCPYVMHLDDDDQLAPNGMAAIRRAILADPDACFMFRMQYCDGRRLWSEPKLIPNNVGTPMFIHPRELTFGHWQPVYGGDFSFIADTMKLNPQRKLCWKSDVVAWIGDVSGSDNFRIPQDLPLFGPLYDLGGVGFGGEVCTTVNLTPPADILADITNLDSFIDQDRSVREFHLTHTLEHVGTVQYVEFLRGLYRKLAPGGRVCVVQSDAASVIHQWISGELSFRAMRSVLFTPAERLRINRFHAHCNMWSAEELARDFMAVGFETQVTEGGTWSFDMVDELHPEECLRYHGTPIRNLRVVAIKPQDRIPNHFHFVFGLKPDFGGRPFGLMHYLAIRSAIMVNRPERVTVWTCYEPSGRWWDLARELVECRHIEDFQTWQDVRRDHYAHRADLARLHILYEYGGIYLDMDTLCVRPFGDLLRHSCVMGWEDSDQKQLCNAIILAEPKSKFVELMLESQRDFQSGMWGEISVLRSGDLAHQNPELVHTLNREAFYWPSWQDCGYELFTARPEIEFPDAICHHLWEHAYWDRGLGAMTVRNLRSGDGYLNQITEKFLAGLSE